MPPTVSWDETQPPATQAFSLGDDRLREVKKQFREIFEVDHEMSSAGNGAEWGYHNQATLIEQAGNPAAVSNACIVFTKEVNSISELHYIDEDGNVMQLTSGTDFIGGMADEIRMFNGTLNSIPTGWSLCDGNGGRPNLIARFIRGIVNSSTAPGTSGGNPTVTLTAANLPNHYHGSVTSASGGAHTHPYSPSAGAYHDTAYGGATTARPATAVSTLTSDHPNTHNHGSITSDATGSATPSSFTKFPDYYELAFIIRG